MKPHKSKKLIIILIVLFAILIICSGVAYAYFATDLLKTDKQLFIKYATQMLDEEKGFLDSDLVQYIGKKGNTPYSNNGKFFANIEGPNDDKFKYTNNMDIKFSGKVDNANSNFEEEISINYADDIKLPFSIKKVGDVIGILQSNYISKKYITSNINKLGEINLSNSITDVENVTSNINKVEKLSNENVLAEIRQVEDEYINILINNLPENGFSQITDSVDNIRKGYKLESDTQTLKNIIIKLLERLKNDKNTLDKINEYLEINNNSNKLTVQSIEKSINSLNNLSENSNFTIIICPEQGRVSKIQFNNKDVNINIEKYKDDDLLEYQFLMDILKDGQKDGEFCIKANYKGLSNLNNVSENYKIWLVFEVDSSNRISKYSYNYNLDNEVAFLDSINIENFAEENSFNLNDLNEEQREKLIKSIIDRLTAVNKKQMDKLGISESENPLINMIPLLGISKISNDGSEAQTMKEIEEAEIATFNSKLELYQGTNISGATVKGLLTVVANTNDSEESDEVENKENLIKEINFNGNEYQVNKQTIALIKEEIAVQDYFRVEFEKYEDNGKIYRVVINRK